MKIGFTISVEQEDAETLDRMCDIMGITRSKLFESTVKGYVATAKVSGILKKKKAGPWDLVRFMTAGVKQEV